MRQDYVFLIEYSRLVALAAAKATSLDTMARFATLLDAHAQPEMALHREFAAECGITAEELATTEGRAHDPGVYQPIWCGWLRSAIWPRRWRPCCRASGAMPRSARP